MKINQESKIEDSFSPLSMKSAETLLHQMKYFVCKIYVGGKKRLIIFQKYHIKMN